MSTEIVTENPPKMLIVSPFTSNIANKMRLLASSIVDAADGDKKLLYIECYTKLVDGQTIKMVRLSDDYGTWCEFSPHDKIDGDILETSVAVNLYDFYNATDNCFSEIVTIWIDSESNELVFNSFYNPRIDMDELEIRFKIFNMGFPLRKLTDDTGRAVINSFSLDAMTSSQIMKELNVEKATDGVSVIVRDGRISFQSDYNGFITRLYIKSMAEQIFIDDLDIFIPFNVFQMMISTGHIYALQFSIYDGNILVLKTEEYGFRYVYSDKTATPVSDDYLNKASDYFVIESDIADSSFGLINRLNKSGNVTNLLIEKVDEYSADITCNIKDRMSISVRTDLAMLSDTPVTVDSDIFERMICKTGTDAVRVKLIDPSTIYVRVETQQTIRDMIYDHNRFSIFRETKLNKWRELNA